MTFLEGEEKTPKTTPMTITNDSNYEANETVNLALSNCQSLLRWAPGHGHADDYDRRRAAGDAAGTITTDDADDASVMRRIAHCARSNQRRELQRYRNTIEFNIPIGMILAVFTRFSRGGRALATITTLMTIDGTSNEL